MDDRVRRYLEGKAGVSLNIAPVDGITVRESPRRTDEPGNRVLAQWVFGSNSALITVMPGAAGAVARAARQMTVCELFSPLGRAELCRASGLVDEPPPQYYLYGFDYVLTSLADFRPAEATSMAVPLRKKDIPAAQFELRMSERRQPPAEDFVWAFACYWHDPAFQAGELGPYGARCASVAVVIWRDGPVATFGVGTEAACRGRGFGLAAVSAATRWVLEQGEVPVYGAYANNIPSLRTARRLGYTAFHQEMGI